MKKGWQSLITSSPSLVPRPVCCALCPVRDAGTRGADKRTRGAGRTQGFSLLLCIGIQALRKMYFTVNVCYSIYQHQPERRLMDFKIKADLSECTLGKELLKLRAFDQGSSEENLCVLDSWFRTPIGNVLFKPEILWCYDFCACLWGTLCIQCRRWLFTPGRIPLPPPSAFHSTSSSLRQHGICPWEKGFIACPDLFVADVV